MSDFGDHELMQHHGSTSTERRANKTGCKGQWGELVADLGEEGAMYKVEG